MESLSAKSEGSNKSSEQNNMAEQNLQNIQFSFLENVLKEVISHPLSQFFRIPVDPAALGIPDYFKIISKPMDLGTMLEKLNNNQYSKPEDCIADFRLMTSNCYTYNREGLPVYKCCKDLEKMFDKKIQDYPHSLTDVSTTRKRKSSAGSYLGSPTRKTDTDSAKRDSKSKQSKIKKSLALKQPINDAYFTNSRESGRSSKKFDSHEPDKIPDFSSAMSYCHTIINELMNKKHYEYNFMFLSPVDPVSLQIPDYHDVIQFPMDLSTVRSKLRNNQYLSPAQFLRDVRLIFTNCYRYNAQTTEVVACALKLQRVFEHTLALVPKELCYDYFVGDSSVVSSSSIKSPTLRNGRRTQLVESRVVLDCFHSIEKKLTGLIEEVGRIKSDRVSSKPHSTITESTPLGNKRQNYNPIFRNQKNITPAKNFSSSQPKSSEFERVENVEPMTHEEKMTLSHQISRLPEPKIKEILGIIHQREPNSKKSSKGSDCVEVDLGFLGSATLRALEKFVNTYNKRRSEGPSRKKASQQDQVSRKQELEKKLQTMESQLAGRAPFIFGGKSDHENNNGSMASNEFIARLSESGSSSEEEDDEVMPKSYGQTPLKSNATTLPRKPFNPPSISPASTLLNPQNNAVSKESVIKSNEPLANVNSNSTTKSPLKPSYTVTNISQKPITTPVKQMNMNTSTQPSTFPSFSASDPKDLLPKTISSTLPSNDKTQLSEIEKKKAEERNKRMALVGKIDMNAQGDLLDKFENF